MLVSCEQSASMRFDSEKDATVMTKVNPKLWVSLIRDRGAYRGGSEKMKRICRGLLSDGSSDGNFNFSAEVDAPIVVAVTDYYRPNLGRSLWEKSLTEEEVQQGMTSDETWFGVVDKNFRLRGILKLMDEEPDVSQSLS